MKYLMITCLVAQTLFGYGQSNKAEIAILKKQVGLLTKVITADSNLLLLDNEALLFELIAARAEKDSIVVANQILQAELLLLENKKQGSNYTHKDFDPGVYVVVMSSKSESDIHVLYDWVKSKNPETPLDIYYNKATSWYHIMVNKTYGMKDIGSTITTYREAGFVNCWYLKI